MTVLGVTYHRLGREWAARCGPTQSMNGYRCRSGDPEQSHLGRSVPSGLGMKPSTIQFEATVRMVNLASILSLPHICVDDALHHFVCKILKSQVVAEVSSP